MHLGTFKPANDPPKTGLYENNILVKEIKPHDHYKGRSNAAKEPLVLSVIPELTKRQSVGGKSWRSRDVRKKAIVRDTSLGRGSRSFRT